MNFLGIRKYPEIFYNFLQFFLNFSELIMIFQFCHQKISFLGQFPSKYFPFWTVPINEFPFWDVSHQNISFLVFFRNQVFEIFPKKEISRQCPKKETSIPPVKLLFHFLTPQENTQKGNFFFWKFLKRKLPSSYIISCQSKKYPIYGRCRMTHHPWEIHNLKWCRKTHDLWEKIIQSITHGKFINQGDIVQSMAHGRRVVV